MTGVRKKAEVILELFAFLYNFSPNSTVGQQKPFPNHVAGDGDACRNLALSLP
jgi:hypothetical protein